MEKIKVFIADDNVAARGILKNMLIWEQDFDVAGEAGSGQGCIIMLEEADPHVVLLEAAIGGGMDILDIIREVRNISPDVKIILCADATTKANLPSAFNKGIDQFISKPYRRENVIRTIKEVIRA